MVLSCCEIALADPPRDYPITPIPLTAVRVDDRFWSPRLETNRTVTIPHNFRQCEQTGRISNFDKAAARLAGRDAGKHEGYFFNDSDVYKAMEAAAYALAGRPDPELDRYLDDLIAKVAAAQEPDGYLYTARTIDPNNPPKASGQTRWSNLAHSHELYCLGHLIEAAVAHHQATGKRTLLDVALKSAALVGREFGPDARHDVPGHQEIELALVKLSRLTGERAYLDLARFFLAERGYPHGRQLYGDYAQDHRPVLDQREPVGHAVRAAYMYCGMTDVAALTGDDKFAQSVAKLWQSMVDSHLYITGGIGARHGGEAFGGPYELPNAAAYAETCAGIANLLWNQRLFRLHGDGKYIDVLERVLYNGVLSGVSLGGDRFFYVNPLASGGDVERQAWFACACCPPNIARILAALPEYIYAQRTDGRPKGTPDTMDAGAANAIYVNLFVGSKAEIGVGDQVVMLTQETRYPWDGDVRIRVRPQRPARFTVFVRIPGWACGRPVPSDLYRDLSGARENSGVCHGSASRASARDATAGTAVAHEPARDATAGTAVAHEPARDATADTAVAHEPARPATAGTAVAHEESARPATADTAVAHGEPVLRMNGEPWRIELQNGYAPLERTWHPGDTIELHLPMPVRRVVAHPNVEADLGLVALERGPLVYCLEGVDHDHYTRDLVLPDDAALKAELDPNLLGGVTTIRGTGRSLRRVEGGRAESTSAGLKAVPYCVWSNRGPGEMTVWLPRIDERAQPRPLPTLASRSRPSTSFRNRDSVRALNDQLEPASSADHGLPRLTWWDHRGTVEWVQYDFPEPATVSRVAVYWFDDTGVGGCRVPASWQVVYRASDGAIRRATEGAADDWQPVSSAGDYGTGLNCFNEVSFAPVKTTALRLQVQLQPGFSGGILEWRVE